MTVRWDDMTALDPTLACLGERLPWLTAATSLPELADVAVHTAAEALPDASGALYVAHGATWAVHATFGDWSGPGQLDADDCWALRRHQPHQLAASGPPLRCRHHAPESACGTLCQPVGVDGQTSGLITVTPGPHAADHVRATVAVLASAVGLAMARLTLAQHHRGCQDRDPLTGLGTRQRFDQALRRAVATALRQEQPVAVVLADLDHFAQIDEALGPMAADARLAAFGEACRHHARAEDVLARWAGDAVALAFPGRDAVQATHTVGQLATHWAEQQHRERVQITFSAGVASFPHDGRTARSLLDGAHRALRQAKRRGRNRVWAAGAA